MMDIEAGEPRTSLRQQLGRSKPDTHDAPPWKPEVPGGWSVPEIQSLWHISSGICTDQGSETWLATSQRRG